MTAKLINHFISINKSSI